MEAVSSDGGDVMTSARETLAKEANVCFQLGKYVDCVKLLNQILEDNKPNDHPKILHNIAIAENFQDGFSNPKRFFEALDNLKKRNVRLPLSSGENAAVGNKGNSVVSNQASTVNGAQSVSADDFDASVIMFNIAVILYHFHEYEKCFFIVEKLYLNIQPIDERVARHVCLLLLDVSLVSHHPSRAAVQVNSNGDAKESKVGNSIGNPLLQSSVNEYEELCGKENHMILQAVLADLAFVYLELGNAEKALATARCLLRLPECSRVYSFFGNVYAAEAYCLLNQPKQASEHLSSYISGQNNIELPYSQEDCDKWQMRKAVDIEEPNANTNNTNNALSFDQQLPQGGNSLFLKSDEARGVLLANMAALAAAEGDVERAQEAITVALLALPDCPEVVLTATYIDLVRGNSRDAVAKLKQCSRVRFLPGTLAEK
nr:CCR4-Not transcription complex subunit 10-like [Tanacetum cinerariifolium]